MVSLVEIEAVNSLIYYCSLDDTFRVIDHDDHSFFDYEQAYSFAKYCLPKIIRVSEKTFEYSDGKSFYVEMNHYKDNGFDAFTFFSFKMTNNGIVYFPLFDKCSDRDKLIKQAKESLRLYLTVNDITFD